jgi:hypothetical protein
LLEHWAVEREEHGREGGGGIEIEIDRERERERGEVM